MRKTILYLLFLTALLVACGPAAQDVPPAAQPDFDATATSAPEAATAAPAATETAAGAEPTEAATEPLPVPTSRGDGLVASDPAQVNLNSGRLVLVEFFRFT
jgi:hypothetical protein